MRYKSLYLYLQSSAKQQQADNCLLRMSVVKYKLSLPPALVSLLHKLLKSVDSTKDTWSYFGLKIIRSSRLIRFRLGLFFFNGEGKECRTREIWGEDKTTTKVGCSTFTWSLLTPLEREICYLARFLSLLVRAWWPKDYKKDCLTGIPSLLTDLALRRSRQGGLVYVLYFISESR